MTYIKKTTKVLMAIIILMSVLSSSCEKELLPLPDLYENDAPVYNSGATHNMVVSNEPLSDVTDPRLFELLDVGFTIERWSNYSSGMLNVNLTESEGAVATIAFVNVNDYRTEKFSSFDYSVLSSIDGKHIFMDNGFEDNYCVVWLMEADRVIKGSFVIDVDGSVYLEPTEALYTYVNLGGGLFERYLSGSDMLRPETLEPQGIVNTDGDLVYSGNLSRKDPLNPSNGFYRSAMEEGFGIYDNNNNCAITERIYRYASRFSDNVSIAAKVGDDATVQIIDSVGNEIVNLSALYEGIDVNGINPFVLGVTALNFDNGAKSIIIDRSGIVIAHTEYESIGEFNSDGIARCYKDGKYGYIDANGQTVLAPIYDWVTCVESGIGFVITGEKQFVFRVDG